MAEKSVSMVILGIVAIAAIVGLVLLFNAAKTGQAASTSFYGAGPALIYKTEYETCRRMMCNDGLQAQATGNVDTLHNLIECRCITTTETGWYSQILKYG